MSEINRKFDEIGARVSVAREPKPRKKRGQRFVRTSVDVRVTGDRETFVLLGDDKVRFSVLDVRADLKQLLLNVYDKKSTHSVADARYLCGFDERHWFAAAIPESADARTVQAAMDALKPQPVWDAIKRFEVPAHERNSRHTAAFIRQGEWFFVRQPPDASPPCGALLRNEPLFRNDGGKPHVCEELAQDGGERVLVNRVTQEVVTERDWLDRPKDQQSIRMWSRQVRDAKVFARGTVTHEDHETIWLDDWHEVVMNTESQASAKAHLDFLD
jgi:hypothetical protein